MIELLREFLAIGREVWGDIKAEKKASAIKYRAIDRATVAIDNAIAKKALADRTK